MKLAALSLLVSAMTVIAGDYLAEARTVHTSQTLAGLERPRMVVSITYLKEPTDAEVVRDAIAEIEKRADAGLEISVVPYLGQTRIIFGAGGGAGGAYNFRYSVKDRTIYNWAEVLKTLPQKAPSE